MAIRYSKVTMNLNCGGTIYSEGKGNTIIRQGDTLFISHDAYARVINVPWVSVAEADVMKFSAEDDFKSFCDKHFKPNSTEPKNTSIAGPKSNCIYCRICGQSDSNHPNSRCQIFSQ